MSRETSAVFATSLRKQTENSPVQSQSIFYLRRISSLELGARSLVRMPMKFSKSITKQNTLTKSQLQVRRNLRFPATSMSGSAIPLQSCRNGKCRSPEFNIQVADPFRDSSDCGGFLHPPLT